MMPSKHIAILEEDEAIAQHQKKDDLKLFGNRPIPQDPEEAYNAAVGPMQLDQTSLTRKSAISEVQEVDVERSSKFYKRDVPKLQPERLSPSLQATNTQLPSIDWNNGKSPLDAWLNQSALPQGVTHLEQEHQEFECR